MDSKRYRIRMHRTEGNTVHGYQYSVYLDKPMGGFGMRDMENGLNYPRAKTWFGRVWNALCNK